MFQKHMVKSEDGEKPSTIFESSDIFVFFTYLKEQNFCLWASLEILFPLLINTGFYFELIDNSEKLSPG